LGLEADRVIALAMGEAVLDDIHELDARRLAAANERLAEQRLTIPALDQRAREVGIDAINTRDDLVPLLFSHANYKSYPESFIAKGQWDRLSFWLDTVAASDVRAVDVAGVEDIDGWIERLNSAGIYLWASSGTSGKCSFIPVNDHDMELNRRISARQAKAWGDQPMPVSVLAPATASMKFAYAFRSTAEAIAAPGQISYLTQNTLRIQDSMRSAAIRKAMIDGTATPRDVEELERNTVNGAAARDDEVRAIAERIFSLRDQPQVIYGFWAPLWRILEIGKELGIEDGTFHPGTIVAPQGGLKGLDLPDDYSDQLARFFGSVRLVSGYGMTELCFGFRMCSDGYFHASPAHTLLILDESGEQLLEPRADGKVRGRIGIYDAGHEGHWGGIVTGDQGNANFSPLCSCGRPGPTLEDNIVRYSELSEGGDDKLTCGGTINSYIRGAIGG